ncbi:hypothetical protein RVW00_000775 [Enterobacter bugandensis]|nr:hypothetical protein [Enterobacter bugandensis]
MKEDKEAAPAGRGMELVRHIDSWKKLIIFMVLALFCVTLYSAWEHRRELAFIAMSNFGAPQIDEQRIEPEIASMMAATGAVGVALWSVNLENNQRRTIFVRDRERRVTSLEGHEDLLLRPHDPLTAEVIELINIKTKCWAHMPNTNVGRSSVADGVTWICSAAIPPQFGVMIGILSVGFTARPENEDYVKARIRDAAQRIIR